MQTVSHMKEFTSMEVFAENAAEYITTGNRRIMDGTLLIYSSVTGSTPEIVKAVEKAHAAHATILAFLDNPNPHLRELCELCISYPQNEQLKLFMVKPQYRGFISHLVTHAVTNRIDVHLEAINCHPMEIRRYYRCLEY